VANRGPRLAHGGRTPPSATTDTPKRPTGVLGASTGTRPAPLGVRLTARQPRSRGQELLCLQLRGLGIDGWEVEAPVIPGRRWRFDVAWPVERLAVEVDGGGWTQGRHSREPGMQSDNAKCNEAQLAGWLVLRVTPRQVQSGEAVRWIQRAVVARHGWPRPG